MLYDLAIVIYDFIVHLAAPFSRKPRKMMKGHWVVYELLRQQVEKGEQYIWFHAASLGEFDKERHARICNIQELLHIPRLIKRQIADNIRPPVMLAHFITGRRKKCQQYLIVRIFLTNHFYQRTSLFKLPQCK